MKEEKYLLSQNRDENRDGCCKNFHTCEAPQVWLHSRTKIREKRKGLSTTEKEKRKRRKIEGQGYIRFLKMEGIQFYT